MSGIENEISLHARNHTWHDEQGASPLVIPLASESAGDVAATIRPPGMMSIAEDLVACPGGNDDLDEMLVGRHFSRMVNKFLKHRGRVVLCGIDYACTNFVPSPSCSPGTAIVPDCELSVRIANTPSPPVRAQFAWVHMAKPASARRRRLTTASAPAELACARASGARPSSNGCGRDRKRRAASISPP